MGKTVCGHRGTLGRSLFTRNGRYYSPPPPEGIGASAVDDRHADIHEHVERPFDIELKIIGALKPNSPIQVEYSVKSLWGAKAAEVTLQLPDVVEAIANNWRPAMASKGDRLVMPFQNERLSMAKGQSLHRRASVTIPYAGYYRVIVAASNDSLTFAGTTLVADGGYEELWLHVTEQGGSVTDEFDYRVFASDEYPVAGPRRRRLSRSGTSALALGTARFTVAGEVRGSVEAYNPHTYTFEKVRYLPLQAKLWDHYSHAYIGENGTMTDGNGEYAVACSATSSVEEMRVFAQFTDARFTHSGAPNGGIASFGYIDCDTGVSGFNLVVNSKHGKAWNGMHEVADSMLAKFGASRSQVEIVLGAAGKSFYTQWADRITLDSTKLFLEYGAFSRAHEWGHAIHHRALGGFRAHACPNHDFQTVDPTNPFECAYQEGVAHYFGAALLPLSSTHPYGGYVATMSPIPGYAGKHEVQVASLLYDLTDPAGDEIHDAVQFPFSYVADLIRTCEVHTGFSWDETGSDYLVYCLEQQIDPSVRSTYFGGKMAIMYRESATEPASWCRGKVRRLWKWNYAGEIDTVALCP